MYMLSAHPTTHFTTYCNCTIGYLLPVPCHPQPVGNRAFYLAIMMVDCYEFIDLINTQALAKEDI
jgi:hypothetical protein